MADIDSPLVFSSTAGKWWKKKRREGQWLEPRTWVPMTQNELQQFANDVLEEFGLIGEMEDLP